MMINLNPRTGFCPVCLSKSGTIMLKNTPYKAFCEKCGKAYYGLPNAPYTCKICNTKLETTYVNENEQIPFMCTACEDKHNKAMEVAKKGGVLFKCLNCMAEGAFSPESEISKKVRETMKISPPKVCGIQLDSCPICEKINISTPTKKEEEEKNGL